MKYEEKRKKCNDRESDGEYTKYKSCVRIEFVRCPSIKDFFGSTEGEEEGRNL
jgi:hypothetical protein